MRNNLNKFQRCPGCGNYMIHLAIKKALDELDIPVENRVIVTAIGCSGKLSQYLDGYAAETLHGRALPFATWVKLANSKLTVVVYMWDGDCYGIGGNHLIHAIRRDVNVLAIVWDNENYGLTTGQASPTTPLWIKTNTTPDGNTIRPFDPIKLTKWAWAKFVETVSSSDVKWMVEVFKKWIQNDWFSFVDVDQACPTWRRW